MVEILSSLSDIEIIAQLSQLMKTEKEVTEQIVRHFAEVERRRLYLDLGYGNLFDYATRGLGHSNAATMRRITAARAGLQAPEAFACLERGELNLSTIEKFAPLMKKHEASGLVEQFKGKTAQEAEEIAAMLNPIAQNEIRDKNKVVSVKVPELDPRQTSLGASEIVSEKITWFRSEVNSKEEGPEKLYHVSFAANEELVKQLERAKELSFQGRKEDLALQNVLEKALGEYLKRRCPKEREARRRARREKKTAAKAVVPTFAENADINLEDLVTGERASAETPTRYVPAAMRDEVLARDEYCCTYVGPSGVRSGSMKNLELDHCVPRSVGGETKPEILRTLCAAHNLHAAHQVFPAGFMDACLEWRPSRAMKSGGSAEL